MDKRVFFCDFEFRCFFVTMTTFSLCLLGTKPKFVIFLWSKKLIQLNYIFSISIEFVTIENSCEHWKISIYLEVKHVRIPSITDERLILKYVTNDTTLLVQMTNLKYRLGSLGITHTGVNLYKRLEKMGQFFLSKLLT